MAFPTAPVNGQVTVVNQVSYQYSTATNSWTRILSTANIITANTIAVNGAITVGTTASVTGNITSANYFIGNGYYITGINVSNLAITNIANGTSNINAGVANGNITVGIGGTGNVIQWASTGEYVTGVVSASGTITGGNLATGGTASATGNITGGNVLTGGLISATGNISGNYILGNGSQLTGIDATSIQNGTSNVRVVSSGGNVSIGIGGTGNVAVFATTGEYITGLLSATGNIIGNNLIGSVVSASGNVTGGNVLTGGLISATSTITSADTITGGNLATGGTASATGNITGGNVLTGGLISAAATITGGNLATGGTASATGNVTGGNILTAGLISAASTITSAQTITAGNLITGGLTQTNSFSITGNVTGNLLPSANATYNLGGPGQLWKDLYLSGTTLYLGDQNLTSNATGIATANNFAANNLNATNNITSGNTVSATGNVTGGNVLTSGLISAAGNVSGNNIIAAGAVIGNVNVSGNITVNSLTANTTISAAGTITGGNLATGGTASAAGNITGGNVLTGGLISATSTITSAANITGANLLTGGLISATATITGGNLETGGTASATGNITGGNVLTSGLVSATGNGIFGNISTTGSGGNISGANVISGTTLSATANVVGGNITTAGQVSAAGNITANTGSFFIGNGSQLTDVTASSVNANNLTGNTLSSNVQFSSLTTVGTLTSLTVSGNTTSGNILTGGSISATATITGGNLATGGTASATGNITGGNLITAGNVYAPAIVNNGTYNTSIELGSASGIIAVTTDGNATQFLPGGQIRLAPAGAKTILSGTLDGSQLVLGTSQTDLVQNRAGNVTVQVGTGGTTANTWTFAQSGALEAPGAVSAVGNVTGGNVLTGGLISATGNVLTGGLVSAAGNITSAANVSGGNILTGGVVSSTGNILTGANVVATANVIGGNISTGGLITATGNVDAGNLRTAGLVSATGNVTGNNITTGGLITATGNIQGGNLIATTAVVTANIIGSADVAITTTANANIYLQPNGTGNIVLATTFINSVASPVQSTDAATKQYVDDAVSAGLTIHTPVYVESPINLVATYADGGTTQTVTTISGNKTLTFGSSPALLVNDVIVFSSTTNGITAGTAYFVYSTNGSNQITLSLSHDGAEITTLTNGTGLTIGSRANSGVGATLTNAAANAAIQIDGVTLTSSQRVLVYQQTSAFENGVYTVTAVGNATARWELTRSTDTNTYGPKSTSQLDIGDYFFVQSGDTGAGESYVVTAPTGTIIFGTTNIVFTQFAASQVYTANTSAGLSLIGTVFNAKVDNVSTAFDLNGNIVVKASANLTTPNIGAATGTSLSTTGNIEGGNLLTGGLISSTGTITGSSLIGSVVTASGNVTGGNVLTGGLISATSTITSAANITGANLLTGGLISATATITGGNLATGGTASATGNITGGNLLTGGLVSATGNVSGNYFIGNGSQLTGVTASSVDANNLTGNTLSSNVLFSSLTSVGTLTGLSVSGNVTGGNLLTGGLISATSTITSADTITGGNLATGGTASAGGNITGGNILTAGLVSATGNGTFGNISTSGASGNISGANVISSTTLSATANITGGNLLTGGLISATSTITSADTVTGGNLATGGTASATGNITGGNVLTGGLVSATGNITGNYFFGNGSQLTGIDATSIQNGTSNVRVVSSGGNVAIGIGGTSNVAVFATTGEYITGLLSVSGNVTGSNILTGGRVSAAGNVVAAGIQNSAANSIIYFLDRPGLSTDIVLSQVGANGNVTVEIGESTSVPGIFGLFTTGVISAEGVITSNANIIQTGNASTWVLARNVFSNGVVTATGNVTGGNFDTLGLISATGNVSGGNILTTGLISATTTITGGNLATGGTASATGNITGGNILTGGQLISTQPGNAATGAGQLFLNGAGNNRIDWAAVGTGAPAFTTRSDGTKVVLYPALSGSTADYAIGIDAATMWYGVPEADSSFKFKWYGGVNEVANLSGLGAFVASGNITTTANIVGGNILFGSGIVSGTGNITGGNVLTGGLISATGNVTGNYILGNGSQLTGIDATSIQNGTSNVRVVSSGGNVSIGVGGTGNVAVFATTGEYITGLLSVSGNITGGNISTAGNVAAGGVLSDNFYYANGAPRTFGITYTAATTPPSGPSVGDQWYNTSTDILYEYTYDGTTNYWVDIVSPAFAAGVVANIAISGSMLVNANATYDIGSASQTFANVYAQYYFGNGSQLTGIDATSIQNGTSNVRVVSSGGNVAVGIGGTSNVAVISTDALTMKGNVLPSANITYNLGSSTQRWNDLWLANSTIYIGNAQISANATAIVMTNPAGGQTVLTGTSGNSELTGAIVSVTGNITGNYILGNGSQLTGIDATSIQNGTSNVRVVSSGGNVAIGIGGTSNVAVFATNGAYVTGNITGGNIISNTVVGNALTLQSTGALNLSTTGNVVFASNVQINNVGYPAQNADAATKLYVDNLVSTAIAYHSPVLAATTTTLATATSGTITYTQPNGAANGVGATLTTTGSFNLIDAANVQTIGTRILVKNEANTVFNGVYTWANSTAIVRATDADTYGAGSATQFGINDYFFVTGGTANEGSAYIVSAPTGTITFGTSGITFSQFSSSQVYDAGTGLTLNGTTFSVNASQTQITSVGTLGSLAVTAGITAASLSAATIGNAGAAITGSSLTVSTGSVTAGSIINANANGVGNIGSSSTYFNTVFAKATSAQYADLAENYRADAAYEPGTVLEFGGDEEVTISTTDSSKRVAGVVSTNPAYLMNAGLSGMYIASVALTGRVPVKVEGPVAKGDLMVSNGNGRARACMDAVPVVGTIIGKSLENFTGGEGTIEVVIGKQ